MGHCSPCIALAYLHCYSNAASIAGSSTNKYGISPTNTHSLLPSMTHYRREHAYAECEMQLQGSQTLTIAFGFIITPPPQGITPPQIASGVRHVHICKYAHCHLSGRVEQWQKYRTPGRGLNLELLCYAPL